MYSTSSQKKFWTFSDESELARHREKHNINFLEKYGQRLNENQRLDFFLTPEEERLLLKQYELRMKELCKRFAPPMPKGVVGTAFHYFKRFYLYNSTMDYHPKEILATCAYLACKVEEFNVSIGQFVANINGDRERASNIILSNELLLMQKLNYNLTIHNPFRPIEGFLIDIKTRCTLANPERLRRGIDVFLEKVFLTDACLLYAPSQIALAAVLHAASKEQENLDSYVTDMLFSNAGPDKLAILIEAVRKIRSMVKFVETPAREKARSIEDKLDSIRNWLDSLNKRKIRDEFDDDDCPQTGSSRMSLDMSGVNQVLSPSDSQ